MSHARVLIVHPDPSIAGLITSMLQALGHRFVEAPNDRAAVRMLEHAPADLVLAGAEPDDADALEFLAYLRRKHPKLPVILLFPTLHPERAREAMIRGVAAVLRFPLPANALRAAVAQALGEPGEAPSRAPSAPPPQIYANGNGNGQVNGHAGGHGPGQGHGRGPTAGEGGSAGAAEEAVVGEDPTFRQALDLAARIAPTGAPVLIVGERGVGKTRLARALHDGGPRPRGPFIEASCSGLKESALDVELFGRRNGGYAEPDRIGKVEQARGGTLFLDDVSALTPDLQVKLLHLLRDGLTRPVGSNESAPADVRVIMGTREELSTLVPDGRFRQDLYYRIGVITLKLPPLRHRGNDLDRLAEHFRVRFARQLQKDVLGFSPEALTLLRSHSWPGNVRELAEAIERAVVVCRGQRIEPAHLALIPREAPAPIAASARSARVKKGILPLKEALEGPERQLILEALEALNWNRQETARVLDINRTTLYKKMKKYGLLFDEPAWVN